MSPSPPSHPRALRMGDLAVDAVIAVVAAGLTVLEMSVVGRPSWAATICTVLACSAPLLLRSSAPVVAAVLAMTGIVMANRIDPSSSFLFAPTLAPLVAMYAVGATAGIVGFAIAGAAGVASAAMVADGAVDDFGVLATGTIVALAVGRAGREIEFEGDALRERNVELVRERDERARAAVAHERMRIARELHDVIGHSISVMGVQAGAVRRRLRDDQDAERDALMSVEQAGRDAVVELHRLLGLLRSHGDQAQELPGSADRIRELAADVRRAGLDVALDGEDAIDELPPSLALTVTRIVQEALTNVLKHAPGARVSTTLRRIGSELHIDVTNDAPPDQQGDQRERGPATGGLGLVGMRERVAVFGGTLETAPDPLGGYSLRATLEVE